jgi:hypothetical protein
LGFPVRPQIFHALAAREFRSQPIEFPPESRSASVISKPEIGEIPCIFPVIRESDKRERGSLQTASTATYSSVSWLSPDPPQSVRKQGGNPQPNGCVPEELDSGERPSVCECAISRPLSLLGILRGHTRRSRRC